MDKGNCLICGVEFEFVSHGKTRKYCDKHKKNWYAQRLYRQAQGLTPVSVIDPLTITEGNCPHTNCYYYADTTNSCDYYLRESRSNPRGPGGENCAKFREGTYRYKGILYV